MATVKPLVLVIACGCSNLQVFSGPVPALVTFDATVTGDLASVRPPGDTGTPDLHISLIWAEQFLIEPLCILPPESPAAAAVVAAGCRDPFGFVPARVDADVAIEPGVPASLDLLTLPTADVLVGDLTARVGYASLVVYDDKDGNGTLSLARPNRPSDTMIPNVGGDSTPTFVFDVVYGASLVTMTQADQRIAFRQGAFVPSAFYPRAGCSDPLPSFSVLSAGGFSAADAISATIAGMLPQEDPASCIEAAAADAPFTIPLQTPPGVSEMKCTERSTDSTVRYRQPGADPPDDLADRVTACVHYPSFGAPSSVIEFVITGTPTDSCVGLTHYILKGCGEGPDCGTPDWDHSAAPPSWWPC